jgi:hypothetical protein
MWSPQSTAPARNWNQASIIHYLRFALKKARNRKVDLNTANNQQRYIPEILKFVDK